MSTATATATPPRAWNIRETYRVEKGRTLDGAKFLNNYLLLDVIGHGRFAKVKLCERVGTDESNLAQLRASDRDVATTDDAKYALKIYSKRDLAKIRDYTTTAAAVAPPVASIDGFGVGVGVGVGEDEHDDMPPPPAMMLPRPRMHVVTALDRVRDEIAILRSLYHRNVVLLFEVIESTDSDKLYLVLEFVANGPCMRLCPDTKTFSSPITHGTLTDALAQAHTRDILNGLAYLHARGICHRDLKPDNVLLTDSNVCRIADFGCARVLPLDPVTGQVIHPVVTDTVGTYPFLAPECCSGAPYDPFKSDIWAVGVMLYIFLFGRLPFEGTGTKQLFDAIVQTELVLLPREVPPLCLDLLQSLMTKNPSERISIEEALQHPWLVENGDEGAEELPSF